MQINSDATEEQIIAAFDKEAKEWQPGIYIGVNDGFVMHYIIDAKRVLLNADLRASYDREYYSLTWTSQNQKGNT